MCVCVLSVALINEAELICTLTHLIAGNRRKTYFLCLSMNMRTYTHAQIPFYLLGESKDEVWAILRK